MHFETNCDCLFATHRQERECNLTQIKIDAIEIIVNHRIRLHALQSVPEFTVPETLRNDILGALYSAIDGWKGVCLKRVTVQPSTFRQYFVIGKNRWDSIKKKHIGTELWLRIFKFIDQVRMHSLSVCLSVD